MDVTTVALYMRLSREDDDMKDESNSISNQRKLLLGFLKKKPEFVVIYAIGQERITEDAFLLGASYYIMKPFDH